MAMRKLVPQLRVEQRTVTVPGSNEYDGYRYSPNVSFSGTVVVVAPTRVTDNRPALCTVLDNGTVRAWVPTSAGAVDTQVTMTALVQSS